MTTATLPALTAGTWVIDTVHSTVGFSVRHLMVSKVRGTFDEFSGTITVAEDGTPAVEAEISVDSINTKNEQRDGHIKSADFFDVEKFPKATFKSTAVRSKGSDFVLAGDFTLHGVTREVELNLEFNGVNPGMGQAPSQDSKPPPSSTARTSTSPSRCPSKAAEQLSATRSRSPSRSKPASRPNNTVRLY